jgi:predicted Zn-dependent peptidase
VLTHLTLKNGAELLCEPVPGSEVTALGFWFLHGSRDETPDEQGFSHFLEHMIFKGTSRRTPREIACDVDRVGGVLNAATEKEVTSVYASVPAQYFNVVLDVICDIAFNATLPPDELEKEKLVVQNEISSIEDSPEEKGYEVFVETVWHGHPLASKIAGTAEAVRAIGRQRLNDFYRSRFVHERLVISVAGGIDASDAARMIEAKLNEYGGRTLKPEEGDRTPPPFYPCAMTREDDFSQAQIYYARRFPIPRRVKDYYEHLLLSTAFGESMSSRLFQNIREDEGLCYSVYSSRTYYSDCAILLLHASTLPDQVPAMLASLVREIGKLKEGALTQQEIDEARLQVKGSLVLGKQDVEVRMKRLARQYIAMRVLTSYEDSFRIIDTVTRDDISRLVGNIFTPQESALLIYGCEGLGDVEKHCAGLTSI